MITLLEVNVFFVVLSCIFRLHDVIRCVEAVIIAISIDGIYSSIAKTISYDLLWEHNHI